MAEKALTDCCKPGLKITEGAAAVVSYRKTAKITIHSSSWDSLTRRGSKKPQSCRYFGEWVETEA